MALSDGWISAQSVIGIELNETIGTAVFAVAQTVTFWEGGVCVTVWCCSSVSCSIVIYIYIYIVTRTICIAGTGRGCIIRARRWLILGDHLMKLAARASHQKSLLVSLEHTTSDVHSDDWIFTPTHDDDEKLFGHVVLLIRCGIGNKERE